MYFSSDLAASVVDRLNSSLVIGGWFVVSPQEISYGQRPGFNQVKNRSVFLFQKDSGFGQVVDETNKYQEFLPFSRDGENSGFEFNDHDSFYTTESELAHGERCSGEKSDSLYVMPPFIQKEILPQSSSNHHQDSISCLQGNPADTPGSLIQAGRLSEAEYLLLQNKNPDIFSLSEMEMLARALADQGDLQQALGWCDRILATDPLRPAPYHLRAVIQQDKGEVSSTIQSLRQALYADPDYIPAHLMLGMLLGTQGRQADSLRHYQVAFNILSALPDDSPVEESDGIQAGRLREMVNVLLNEVKG